MSSRAFSLPPPIISSLQKPVPTFLRLEWPTQRLGMAEKIRWVMLPKFHISSKKKKNGSSEGSNGPSAAAQETARAAHVPLPHVPQAGRPSASAPQAGRRGPGLHEGSGEAWRKSVPTAPPSSQAPSPAPLRPCPHVHFSSKSLTLSRHCSLLLTPVPPGGSFAGAVLPKPRTLGG